MSAGGIRGFPRRQEWFLRLSTAGAKKMAKKSTESGVYRVTEIIGTSTVSWEAAAKNAVDAAAKSLRDLRVAEISKLDMKIEGGKVIAYRARVLLSFKYDA
jgi:flavin-binding protein dodecin